MGSIGLAINTFRIGSPFFVCIFGKRRTAGTYYERSNPVRFRVPIGIMSAELFVVMIVPCQHGGSTVLVEFAKRLLHRVVRRKRRICVVRIAMPVLPGAEDRRVPEREHAVLIVGPVG